MKRLLSLAALLLGCAGPSQHNEARWGVRRVEVTGCLSPHLVWVDEALQSMNAFGPTWRRVAEGEASDVTLACVELPASCGCAGQFTLGSRVARVDESRVQGHLDFLHVVQHELSHWERLSHICRYPGETSECSPVGYGDALMNPTSWESDAVYAVPTVAPTELDLWEWNRAHPGM